VVEVRARDRAGRGRREVYARPEYIALAVLQRGTLPNGSPLPEGLQAVKLDRQALVDAYGAEFLKRLPRPYVYAKEGGIQPDFAATMLGFHSGDELVMALANAKPMRALIEAETDARMKERHGDMLLDGSIADQARAAVQNEERSKVIEAEMKALRKKQREVAGFVRQERDRGQREADYAGPLVRGRAQARRRHPEGRGSGGHRRPARGAAADQGEHPPRRGDAELRPAVDRHDPRHGARPDRADDGARHSAEPVPGRRAQGRARRPRAPRRPTTSTRRSCKSSAS
jgi:hypothetical protein